MKETTSKKKQMCTTGADEVHPHTHWLKIHRYGLKTKLPLAETQKLCGALNEKYASNKQK